MLVHTEINEQILKGELGQKNHLKKMAPVLTILSNAGVRLNLRVYQTYGLRIQTTIHPCPGASGTTPTCQNHDRANIRSDRLTGFVYIQQDDRMCSKLPPLRTVNSTFTMEAGHHSKCHRWTKFSFKLFFF